MLLGDVTTTRREYFKIFRQYPKVAQILAEAVKFEESDEFEKHGNSWYWYQVHCDDHRLLKRLCGLLILDVAYESNKSTSYRLHNRSQTKELLSEWEAVQDEKQLEQLRDVPVQLPEDIFEPIVGMEDLKWELKLSLESEKPVHFLLWGPASSSKSLFLSEIGRLPNARFTVSGSTSSAGLEDFVLDYRPSFLLLDELDKMKPDNFSVLYTLMEFGLISRIKKRMIEQESLNIRIYAAANHLDPIPREIRSRFLVRKIPEYDERTFEDVVKTFLVKRENADRDSAEYIAVQLAKRGCRDPRVARHLARLGKTKQDLDRLLNDPNILFGN